MAVGGLIVGAFNAVALLAIGSRFMTIWGLAFGIAVPLVGIGQAWYQARKEPPGPPRLRLAAATLSGVILAEGAMLPLTENLRECRAAADQR
jgi:hypothetical protein